MKRVRRRLFNFAAAVLLLILVLTVIIWPLSYWQEAVLRRSGSSGSFLSILLRNGELSCFHVGYSSSSEKANYSYEFGHSLFDGAIGGAYIPSHKVHFPGIEFAGGTLIPDTGAGSSLQDWAGYSYWRITAQFWFLIVGTAWPFLAFAMNRRRDSRTGCCPACGYDLRATPDRCPECGEIPPTVKGTAT